MSLQSPSSSRASTSEPGRSAAITASALRRTFKGGIEAVREIDLAVAGGEVFGFLGPNGAGKTTTVRMLCTLLPPTSGSATVAGLDVVRDAAEVRRRVGVALQEIGLDPVQTGRELLELQCGLYGITGRRARERTTELLELVGLTDGDRVAISRLTSAMNTLAHISPRQLCDRGAALAGDRRLEPRGDRGMTSP